MEVTFESTTRCVEEERGILSKSACHENRSRSFLPEGDLWSWERVGFGQSFREAGRFGGCHCLRFVIRESASMCLQMGWGQGFGEMGAWNLGAGCLKPPFPGLRVPTTCFDDVSNRLL